MKTLFFRCIISGLFCGCTSGDKDMTKLDSDDYKSTAKRIKILRSEIKVLSEFKDAEFELFNVNGFQDQRASVPRASSRDYKFVVKTDPVNITYWTNGLKQTELKDYDVHWMQELIKNRKQHWKTNSDPECFVREGENVTVFVFRNEGIIYKRVTNL